MTLLTVDPRLRAQLLDFVIEATGGGSNFISCQFLPLLRLFDCCVAQNVLLEVKARFLRFRELKLWLAAGFYFDPDPALRLGLVSMCYLPRGREVRWNTLLPDGIYRRCLVARS